MPVINFGDQLVIDVTLLTTIATLTCEGGLALMRTQYSLLIRWWPTYLAYPTNILFDGAIDLTDTTTFTEGASIDEQEAAVIASGIFAVINDQDAPLDVALNNFLKVKQLA